MRANLKTMSFMMKEIKKMTERLALTIADTVLNDVLYEMEQYNDDKDNPEYYQEIKDAIEVLKQLSKRV